MNSKSLIWLGMILGSVIGGYISTLWGADLLSISSLIMSAICAIIGIWLGFKLSA